MSLHQPPDEDEAAPQNAAQSLNSVMKTAQADVPRGYCYPSPSVICAILKYSSRIPMAAGYAKLTNGSQFRQSASRDFGLRSRAVEQWFCPLVQSARVS